MKPLSAINITVISLLLVTGCTMSTGPHLETGCPPGQVRVEEGHTGEYDCASEREYEDIIDAIDEHSRGR